MPKYVTFFSYTGEAWARMVKRPDDGTDRIAHDDSLGDTRADFGSDDDALTWDPLPVGSSAVPRACCTRTTR